MVLSNSRLTHSYTENLEILEYNSFDLSPKLYVKNMVTQLSKLLMFCGEQTKAIVVFFTSFDLIYTPIKLLAHKQRP